MFFLTFIASLVLLIAGQDWFSGAETLGWVLLAITVGLFVLQIAAFGLFSRSAKKQFDRF